MIDELELLNATKNGDKLKPLLDSGAAGYVKWKKKYARWPRFIGGHFVWRRYYWVRKTMADYYDVVYALKEPRLDGHFYSVWEIVHDDHLKKHIKGGVVKVK